MELTNEQKYVIYKVVSGVREHNLHQQCIGGYAGVGKTTIIRYLTQFFPRFGVCAFTGKAANVLRRKGIDASTIHSRIYKPHFEDGQVFFDLTDNPQCEGFIVDEASMVSEDIYSDLKSFNIPMIFVGDHGQLEPIGSDFNLMRQPDFTLEEIHRNAGDIAKFANHIRQGYSPRAFRPTDGSVQFMRGISTQDLLEVDQVICAFNRTRVQINNQIREAMGYTGLLNEGERVMCLRNNRHQGLFNGMQGIVAKLYEGRRGANYMDLQTEDYVIQGVKYDARQFGQESYELGYGGKEAPNPFDYGYCITAHKAQGDEWDKVMVIEQKTRNWDHRRWGYTAASRPKVLLKWRLAT